MLEKYLPSAAAALFAILILYMYFTGHMNDWKKRAACTERITGILKRKYVGRYYWRKNMPLICEFYYTYQGREYTGIALDEPSLKAFNAYEEGERYDIYVNPQKPKHIRCWSVEAKYHFLLDGLRNLFFIISIPCTIVPIIVNLKNQASWNAWILPLASAFVMAGCIVSVNRDKKWRN